MQGVKEMYLLVSDIYLVKYTHGAMDEVIAQWVKKLISVSVTILHGVPY